MARIICSLFITLLMVFSISAYAVPENSEADNSFVHSGIDYEAQYFEKYLSQLQLKNKLTRTQYLRKANQALAAKNNHGAINEFIAALSIDAKDAATWLALAEVYLATETNDNNEKYTFQQRASITAYKAYKLARNDELKARALVKLAEALKSRSYWRPAINAYKASLAIKEDAAVRVAYKDLVGEHGFRILNYKVDSETESPRLCVQFSEILSKGKVDFSKFVTVDGKDPAGVVREDKQLCVDGLSHGKRFVVKVREGLPSELGEKTLKSSDLTVYVRDRKPAVRFSGNGYVLPKTGQAGIPLVTTNTNKLNVEIYRVGDRGLNQAIIGNYLGRSYDGYSVSRLEQELGQKIWSGEMSVKSELNKDVTTALPVTEAIKDLKPGLYVAYASPASKEKEQDAAKASQWFVVSDIGIATISGKGGMDAFVRSLTTAEPVKDVTVRLVARNNEVLGTAKTDANGHVSFDKGLLKGEASMSPHMLVAERDAGDYAFLDITNSSFDLTDRGVGGRAAPGPLDAYMFTERGVYRTGETVYLTALLRDQAGKAVPKVPLTLVVYRADGVEFERVTLQDEGDGGRTHVVAIPNNAASGRWSASLFTDPKQPSIGHVSFLVEDYTPQRMEMTLTSEDKIIDAVKDVKISTKGRYLYGAPASNMELSGEILIRQSAKGLEDFKGYRFGMFDEKFLNINKPLSDLPKTDGEGAATLVTRLPEIPTVGKILEAQYTIRLSEPGGRNIAEQISFDIKPQKTLVGIKPAFNSNHVGEGETADFDVVAVSPEGKQIEIKGLKWELLRVETRYQWFSNGGSWNYETITYTTKVADGSLETKTDAPVRISKSLEWGTYRLDITSEDEVNGPRSSYQFSSGWYATANTDRPDKLDIALDKKTYKAGDTLTVNLAPRNDGKALVAIVDDKVLAIKNVDVSKSGTKVDFEIGKEWGAGAYVTAMFYRPMDEKARRMPTRSIGIAWVQPNLEQKAIKIGLDLPEKIRPNSKFEIPVKLEGLKEGAEAKVVVAAVDVGILNLTRYESPKPDDWYYGQRLLGAEIRDIYGKLIDGMQGAAGQIRSGGGSISGFAAPPTKSVEPVALYSGIVLAGKDGTAKISFDMPAFDGTVRVMAVAWTGDQLGSAEKDVIVRDPVVVVGTAPYFLTSGDISNLQFSLDNVEGPAGDYSYKVTGTGSVEIKNGESKATLATKERKQFSVPITAKGVGSAKLELALSGPDGFALKREFNFSVHPAAPNLTRRFVSQLSKDSGQLTVSKDVAEGLIPETVKVSVNVDKSLVLDVPGLLLALDRYPYGCAEQTTSRALPLLYLSKVAEQAGVAGFKGAKERIEKAIERLAGMQGPNGSFGMWSPYYGENNVWLTAYVTDFLTRARELGYKVPSHVFDQALESLQNSVNYVADFKSGGEGLAYSLYVLARNGRAGIGDLRYFADAKLGNFSTALAQAQLGAALAMYGDKERANQAYGAALVSIRNTLFDTQYRHDYGSPLRDGAAALTLISETKTSGESIASLSELLEKARTTKVYTSTQENAWMLLAAHALQSESKDLKLAVNGAPHSGSLKEVLTIKNLTEGDYVVTNRTGEEIQAALTITGDGEFPEPAASEGFRIAREVYTLDGQAAKLEKVKQNDRFVIVLKVEEIEAREGRLMLVDRIPAGFEIENPSLVTGSDVKQLPWLKNAEQIEHSQFKDDKFQAAFDMSRGYQRERPSSMTAAFIVRAVSPGTYLHPAATIEDMYRPDRFARTEASKVTIVAK